MEMPQTDVRAVAFRAMELNMIEADLMKVMTTCREHQAKLGRGVLVLRMDPDEIGIPTFWKAIADGIPDPEFFSLANQADATTGVLTVLMIYPDRVSGYVLLLNTSPAWRELTNRLFAIVDERVVEAPPEPERPAQVPLRPSDLEQGDEFL
jgi:hypothetical protein